MIPYGRQNISDADIDAVVEILKSDYVTQGPKLEAFEAAVAAYCGAQYAVAVSSATAALHIACLAAELGPGDHLWTSPNSFVASANCGLYCGARVDFVDIEMGAYNMSVERLEEKLRKAAQTGRLPKVVVPVHFAGQSCDMQAIRDLSERYGFFVLEDGAHALGGTYQGAPVGCCEYSDCTVFSFHPVKSVTCGEGGVIVTNRHDLYATLRELRSHGITRDAKRMQTEPQGPWYYELMALGYNYRLSDIHAALGLSQMNRLNSFINARRRLARRYHRKLASLPLHRPKELRDRESAWHLYVIRLRSDVLSPTRAEVISSLRAAGIGAAVHYIPIHVQPYYRRLGFEQGDFPIAESYYKDTITLPLFPGLTDDQQDHVVDTLNVGLL